METSLPTIDPVLFGRFQALAADVLDLPAESFTPSASFTADLGIDSLDLVELVEAVETEFGIRIDDEDLAEVATVADAYELVARGS